VKIDENEWEKERTGVKSPGLEHRSGILRSDPTLAHQTLRRPVRRLLLHLQVLNANARRSDVGASSDAAGSTRTLVDVLVVLVGDGGTGTGHAKLGSVGTTVAETAGEGAVDGGAGGEVDGGADVKDGGEPGVVGGGEVEDPENLQRGKGSVRCTLSIGSSLRTSTMARRTHPAPIESWYEVSAKMPELEREVLSVRLKHLSKKREKYALGTESSHHESDSEEDGELQIVGPGQKMLVFREVGGRTHLEAVGTNTIRRKGHKDADVEEELEEDACWAKEMREKEEN
jgi:hypothetical protein